LKLDNEQVVNSTVAELMRLDEAARRLGCHVETLRIRVRDGRLAAVRGRHGAYLVSETALRDLQPPRWGRVPDRVLSGVELADAWASLESVVGRSGQWRQRELEIAETIFEQPSQDLPTFRLISVHRLRRGGVGFDQIASELGISARHARRLYRRRVFMALRRRLNQLQSQEPFGLIKG
jgi:excisionase family DNA binding protein